jgi:hypothetical protein
MARRRAARLDVPCDDTTFGAMPPRSLCTLAAAVALASGCYHYSFELASPAPASTATVTYKERVPTWVNGFVGTGTVDTSRYCPAPIRTELRVMPADVLLSAVTLLIYTPHTLYVTCPAAATAAR